MLSLLKEGESVHNERLIMLAIKWKMLRQRLSEEHPRTLDTNRAVTEAQFELDKEIDTYETI